MNKKPRKCVSSDEAVAAQKQHLQPCSDCPWRRDALRGWFGGNTSETYLKAALGDAPVSCHVRGGPADPSNALWQCAGAAIFRRNIAKLPRDPSCLKLPADRETVFASPQEFLAYHGEDGDEKMHPDE